MFFCAVSAIASALRASCMPFIIFSISISGSLCFVFTASSPCWNQHEDPYLHQPFREKNRNTSFPGVCFFLESHIFDGSVLGAHISPLIGIHLLDVLHASLWSCTSLCLPLLSASSLRGSVSPVY
jgi:hypothetical protein